MSVVMTGVVKVLKLCYDCWDTVMEMANKLGAFTKGDNVTDKEAFSVVGSLRATIRAIEDILKAGVCEETCCWSVGRVETSIENLQRALKILMKQAK